MQCPIFNRRVKEFEARPSLREILVDYISKIQIESLDDFIRHLMKKNQANLTDEADKYSANYFYFGEDVDPKQLHYRKVVTFLLTYRQDRRWNPYALLLQDIIKFEQGFLLWKNRHPRTVEITIGRRIGTGGSSGVAYLDSTTMPQHRIFKDLIRIRGECVKQEMLGDLDSSGVWHPPKEEN